jgi:micrococcal nuclease
VKPLVIVLFVVVAVVLVVPYVKREESSQEVVARVLDGDTIELVGGQRVRLVQIDTPEKGRECYGNEATAATRRLIPPGTRVRIEQDPALDQVDRFQRKLAYVWKGDEDVNVTLVREGAAGVWFFRGKQGRYATEFLRAADRARAGRKGLWGACPLARFDPLDSLASGPG